MPILCILPTMTALTIRNFDETLKRKLKIRAAEHGRSMEAEAASILERELTKPAAPKNIGKAVRDRLAKHGLDGIDLELPPRSSSRDQVSFDE
jgi:antitoxin FitA